MNSVLLKRNNSHILRGKCNSIKALAIATVASLVIFGFNTAQAEENSISLGGEKDLLTSEGEFTNSREGYLSLRVNPSPENLTFANAQVDFQPSPVGRGGVPTGFAAEITPTLDDMNTKANSFTPTGKYDLTTTQGTNTHFLILDNGSGTLTQYWYTPNEGTAEKNNILNYLTGTSLTTTGATADNYVFKQGDTYYTFDMTKPRPTSAYTLTAGTSGNYDIKTTDGTTTNYYNFAPKNTDKLEWSAPQTSAPTGYTWADILYAGASAGSKVIVNTTDRIINGAIRTGIGTITRYYTYTYTLPEGNNSIVQSRINNTIAEDGSNVQNKVFAGIWVSSDGGAIYNTKDLPSVTIIADFIGNSARGWSNLQDYGGAIYNRGTISISGDFIGNSAYFYQGGAIANTGTIIFINGDFICNSSNIRGGAIWNNGTNAVIGTIVGDFIGNRSSGSSADPYGGAIYNTGTINSIVGDFIWNIMDGSNSMGGAIYNNSAINSIAGDFVGNRSRYYGGAICNRGSGSTSITGDFVGNYATSTSTNKAAFGGAIYNSGIISSITGDFIGNYAEKTSTSYKAYGGAVYNGTLSSYTPTYTANAIITLAGNTFTGNYVDNNGTITPNGIYNAGIINIANGVTVTINDGFQSLNSARLVMGAGSTLNMNIANGTLQDDSLGTFTQNGTINATVDINFGTNKADTIATSSVTIGDGYDGVVNLNALNILDDIHNATSTTKIQILKTQASGLKLVLSDAVKEQLKAIDIIQSSEDLGTTYDAIAQATGWGDLYYSHSGVRNTISRFGLAKTTTDDDSLGYSTVVEDNITDTIWGDSLKLVVADTTNASKEFNAAAEGDSYTVGDNLGTLAGTLTISGVAGGNLETVNLNGNSGITIAGANTLNLNNVKLTDTSTGRTAANTTIATVTNNGANVNLNNTELNGNIVSESGYNLGLSGNSTLGGSIGKATVTTDTATVKLANNTFTNADVTTDANSTFDLTGDGLKTYEFNTLTSNSDTKWNIDFNISSTGVGSSDIIKTIAASTGTVKLDNLNITGDIDDLPEDMKGNVFVVQILDTQDSNLQLDLSDYVKSQLGTSNYEIGRTTLNKDDVVVADNTWTTQYDHKTQDEVSYGKLGLATTTTTNDSIGVTFDHKELGSVVNHGKRGDTLVLVNQSDIDGRNFTTTDETATYVVGGNLGATGTGEFTVQGATDGENTSKIDFNGKSGFDLSNAGTTLNIKDVEITGANVFLSATAGDSIVNLDGAILDGTNGGITSNGTINVKGNSDINDTIAITDGTFNVSDNSVIGGDVTLSGTTAATVKDNSQVSGDITLSDTSSATLSDNSSVSGDITLNDTTKLTVTGDKVDVTGTITGDSTAELKVKDGTFEVKNTVSDVNTVLDNGQLKLTDESLFTAGLTVNTPSNISMMNDKIGVLNFNSLTLNDTITMQIDADLALKTIDTIDAGTVTISGGSIKVDKINILHPTTETELSLLFTNNSDLAGAVSYTGEGEIVYSPIFKYTTTYENKDGQGYFKFVLPSSGGGGGGTPAASDFNPAVLATPVAAQGIAQVGMNHVFSQSFEHADGFMPLPETMRMSMLRGNQYAVNYPLPTGEGRSALRNGVELSNSGEGSYSLRVNPSPENLALADDAQADFLSSPEGRGQGYGVSTDFNDNLDFNSETETTYNNKAIWVKPYTSFERINLHNGPKVDMISYGTLVGGDSDFRQLKNGWSNVGTLYLGYNGASMDYSGVDTTFNGGVLGITESFYKKNFFTAISANVGAGFAEAQTMYGHDDMTMLMAGVASKTGYNFEFKEGRFIIQPSLLLSYSMINTFDYTNSAGVKIDSDPLHTIQLNPNVKFIANLKHGWQPYASVGMVYNLMNETKVTANNVKLPETSTRPYVEYGIGVQKHFGETFSGYGQAMVRNGGRNGIALTAGFRWALGGKKAKKDNKNVIKDDKTNDVKTISSDAPQEVEAIIPVEQKTVDNNVGLAKPTYMAKDSTPQVANGKKTVTKSVKQNKKSRNLARYIELIGE